MEEVGRFDATKGPHIVGPRDGAFVDLGAISARLCGKHGLRFPPLVM
jgi:hypothetical protein